MKQLDIAEIEHGNPLVREFEVIGPESVLDVINLKQLPRPGSIDDRPPQCFTVNNPTGIKLQVASLSVSQEPNGWEECRLLTWLFPSLKRKRWNVICRYELHEPGYVATGI